MARRLFSILTLSAAAVSLLAAAAASAQAQDSKTITKGSGKYEEHYELLPPEAPDPAAPVDGGANLDPEGGMPKSPQSPGTVRKPAAVAPHKGPFAGSPPSNADRATAGQEPPPPEPAAYPEPERIDEPAPTGKQPVTRPQKRDGKPGSQMEGAKAGQPADEAATGDKSRSRPAQTFAEGDPAAGPSAAFFYDALDEGGDWIDHPMLGKVFSPKAGDGWRPYTRGWWAYSDDYGWVWVSQEPFGWATYHYGRWTLDEAKGWLWVPGTEWAPSWVVWRQGEDAIGWAPLPPAAKFTDKGVSFDAAAIESESFLNNWVFVDTRYFGRPGMSRYLRPARWNGDLTGRTQARLGYQRGGGRIANRGIAVEDIERLAKKPLTRVTLTLSAEQRWRFSEGDQAGSDIKLYRPDAGRMKAGASKVSRERSVGDDATGEGKSRRPAPPKAAVKFAPQPIPQRTETEGGVTESWLTPVPAASERETNSSGAKSEAKAAETTEKKFTPSKSVRTETEGSVTETWISPPKAPARSKSTKREDAARDGTASERAQGSRSESYSEPSPEEAGDTPPNASTAKSTGSVRPDGTAKQKPRWDSSGASGGPSMVPGSVQ